MSSLVERLRARSENRPSYNIDFDSDEEPVASKKGKYNRTDENFEKFVRDDAKEDACQTCGDKDNLIVCSTCTYAFHLKCLLPPRKVAPDDGWSCPECVSPLNEVEKILDWEMRPMIAETELVKQETKPKNVRHYLVKWKGLSHLHCSWIPEDEFKKACKTNPRMKTRLNKFKEQMDSIGNSEDEYIAVRPEWTTVDRVIASRKIGDEREYFVKWKELGYENCSWEYLSDISAFQPQIERYKAIQYRRLRKSLSKTNNIDSNDSSDFNKQKEFQHYDQTPEFLSGTLHPYQLEGLNFLRYSWSKKTHVILADEMGLGKTIQSIAYVTSLFKEELRPHLIVAPLSTLRNWEREFATWAPELNVIMYAGSAPARAIARQYEFFYSKEDKKGSKSNKDAKDADVSKQDRIKFDVLLTSYEMINHDSTSLKPIQWESMIVDEGHRLKNKDSKLFLQLKLYPTKHRVLLTGTPLQNNLDELFMLMHFLDDGKFQSIEDFQKEFKDINQEEQIARLHKMLAPHLLRRVKKDVMKDLPAKKELILRVDLSSIQKDYYKAILTRNYQILARRGGAQISLINVVMELRKLCCHAFMLEGVEPEIEPTDVDEGLRKLLEYSGKMQLLDKMMVKLKERGHRVLIYSQFQHMLDLLEDYLCYKKWSYERIDGKVSGAERQIRIDRYNANNSTRFCFLLSTRAGGLGINLATADTVIIYDSDWNPHADLQAMARAHRLGQINKVMIYRLITRGTIEERMMQLTKKKMILEHLVVGRLKAQQTVNQEELDDIIRYGSKELFVEEDDEASKARQIHYDEAAIERLLDREQIDEDDTSIDEEDDSLLKAFKVANFEFIDEIEAEAAAAKEEEARKQSMKEKAFASDKATYWEDLLKDRYEVHQIEEFTAMGKGKRSRRQMTTAEDDDLAGVQDVTSEDDDYSCEDDMSEGEITLPGNTSGRKGRISRKRARADYAESLPLMKGEGKSLRILGFNQLQRANFLKTLMRFGFGDYDWKEFVPRLKGKSLEEIHEYGFLFMKHIDEGINDSPVFSDGVPKEGLRVDDLLVRLAHIILIKEKLKFLEANPGSALFPDDIKVCYPSLGGRKWKEEHDVVLLKAILKHGYARWQSIVEDKALGLYEVSRQELNLPVIKGHCAGNSFNEADAAKGTQSTPDSSNFHQFKEVQRRIVEFIRKRYQLLEKILDLEICLAEDEKVNPTEPAGENAVAEPRISEIHFETMKPDMNTGADMLFKDRPNLESIAVTSEDSPSNNNAARPDMLKLDNGLHKVAESDSLNPVKACVGHSSASSNSGKQPEHATIYDDVHTLAIKTQESRVHNPVVGENGFTSLSNTEPSVLKEEKCEVIDKLEGPVIDTSGGGI